MDSAAGVFDDGDFDDGEFSRWGDYDCAANQYIEPKWPIVLLPQASPLRKQATQPTRRATHLTPQAAFTTRSPVKATARPQLLEPIAETAHTSLMASEELADEDTVVPPGSQSLYRSQSTNALTTPAFNPSEYDPAKESPLSLLVITPTQFNWSSTSPTLRQATITAINDWTQAETQSVLVSGHPNTVPEPQAVASGPGRFVTAVAMPAKPVQRRLPQLKSCANEDEGGNHNRQDISEIRSQLAALVRASREKAWVHENGTQEQSPLLRVPPTCAVPSRLPRHAKSTATAKTRLRVVDAHYAHHRRQSLAGTPTVDSLYYALPAPRRQSLDGAFAAIEDNDAT